MKNQNSVNRRPTVQAGTMGDGPQRLAQSYVTTLKDLVTRSIAGVDDTTSWQPIVRAFEQIHADQYQQVWGIDEETATQQFMRYVKIRIEALSRLFRHPDVPKSQRDALITDLESVVADAAVWPSQIGRVDAAYQRHVAIGWVGLRHAVEAGFTATDVIEEFGLIIPEMKLRSPPPIVRAAVAPPPPPPMQLRPSENLAKPSIAPRSVPPANAEPLVSGNRLNGDALRKSVFPTWVGLVGLSWISLAWGALISIPFGVGIAIIGSFIGGLIGVPLWGTIFGFVSMGDARHAALRQAGFQRSNPDDPLAQATARMAGELGIPTPEVGTIDICNAFAMGRDTHDASVAIGRPLLERLTIEEADAVIGHELGHVVSGDMRRMMLMRTFQNATVWFMFFQGAKQFVRWIICWAAELWILAFSRRREYWADAIGAALTSKEAMIGALRTLSEDMPYSAVERQQVRFMFRGETLSTHPSMADRIRALENETYLKRLPRTAAKPVSDRSH